MSCPAWEKCFHEECNREVRCCNPGYWASLSRKALKEYNKMIVRMSDKKTCTKDKHNICDKRRTCEFLGQCVFSIESVKENSKLIKALCGKKSMKQVLEVLKVHNPKPMRSYYLHLKKKK